MAEVMTSVTGIVVRVRDNVCEKLAAYTLDRLVWCLAAIGLCWCEVQNYHEYIFYQKMYIMVGVGAFYCWKLGCFTKGKRLWCGIATAIGAAFTAYAVGSNLYNTYYYLNWPIGLLATVTLNLYVLVIYDCIKERRFPFSFNPSMVLILMVIAQQFSVYDYRRYYLYMLLGLLPYIMMKKGVRTRSCMLNGMMDGMCIGFFLVQGYAWMHRPYNYSAIRYTAFSNDKTTAARVYLAYYAVWIIRYAQIAGKKINIWNILGRVFTWFMAAFVLALVYLTGSRSAVLAIMAMTAIAVAVRYYRPKDKWYKRLGKCGLWLTNCICVGLVSLALFPTAYASVRYLPAYFNEPDYYDSIGYRLLSKPIQEWGENFGWNFEYDEFAVKKDEPEDSVRYPTFEEAVHYTLGRVVPDLDESIIEKIGEEIFESELERTEVYYQKEYWRIGYYKWRISHFQELCLENSNEDESVVAKEIGENKKHSVVVIYKDVLDWLLSRLVLHIEAMVNSSNENLASYVRGDSSGLPLYSVEEYPGNGIKMRAEIHKYAISKLNMEGHMAGSFQIWILSNASQPHAHNIFLITGYDFGIPTMLLKFLLFIVTLISGIYNMIRFHRVEYLFPILLISGMTVFGWFESGFHYKSGMFVWIILCVIFTDVLHVKKKADE